MQRFKIILKGLWVGSTMTVPGVSGGTMAVVVGIYEDLIHAVNGLKKAPQEHIFFLVKFILGAGIGFFAFARFITFLLGNDRTGEITRLFFCGIVAGGIPLLVKKTGIRKIQIRHIFLLFLGMALVLLLTAMPAGMFTAGNGFLFILLQIAGGILIAIALILPGISVTHMLYIMGLYEIVVEWVYNFRLVELLPLVAGVFLGTFFTTDILERLMKCYPAEVYMVIIGFVAGSVTNLIPKEAVQQPFEGIVIAAVGFICMYLVSNKAVEG